METKVHLTLAISRRIAAMDATHGTYISTNTRNAAADRGVKVAPSAAATTPLPAVSEKP